MNRKIYLERMTFSRYDGGRCLVYLNEEKIENHVPADAPEGFRPVTAYAYTGPEDDGGTLIEAADEDRHLHYAGREGPHHQPRDDLCGGLHH